MKMVNINGAETEISENYNNVVKNLVLNDNTKKLEEFLSSNKDKNICILWGVKPWINRRAMDIDIIKKNYIVIDLDLCKDLKINREDIPKIAKDIKNMLDTDENFKDYSHIVNSWNWLHIYYFWETQIISNNKMKKYFKDWTLKVYDDFEKLTWYKPDSACANIWRIIRLPGSINNKVLDDPVQTEFLYQQDSESSLIQKLIILWQKREEDLENEKIIIKDIKNKSKEIWSSFKNKNKKDLYSEINDIKIEDLVCEHFNWDFDWKKHFTDKWSNKLKWCFKSEEWNFLIHGWTDHLPENSIWFSPFTFIKEAKNLDNKWVFNWFKDKFPHIKQKSTDSKNDIIYSVAKNIAKKYLIAAMWKNYYEYDSSTWIWNPINIETLNNIIINFCNTINIKHSISTIDNIRKYLDTLFYEKYWEGFFNKMKNWNINVDEIAMNDWIYNIQTLETRPIKYNDYLTHKLPYNSMWFENTKCDKWISFLDSVFENKKDKTEVIKTVQEFMWYSLIPSVKHEKALILNWSWGNWKSVFANILREVVWWRGNVSSIWLKELSDHQKITHMQWKLLNIDSDVQAWVQLDTSEVKKIVSWEPLISKTPYQLPVEFIPTARLVFLTNKMPYLKSIDKSILRRFLIITFDMEFTDKNKDINLESKLKEELAWIFKWAIEWLKRLNSQWKFTESKSINNSMMQYLEDQDTIATFLNDSDSGVIFKYIWKESKTIPSVRINTAYMRYSNFTTSSWQKPVKKKGFKESLKNKWYEFWRTWWYITVKWFDIKDVTEN